MRTRVEKKKSSSASCGRPSTDSGQYPIYCISMDSTVRCMDLPYIYCICLWTVPTDQAERGADSQSLSVEAGSPSLFFLRLFHRSKNMAAPSPSDTADLPPSNLPIQPEQDCRCAPEDVSVKRDPVVSLLSPVTGLQPLVWSQDHRLAVCTSSSLSVMELVCDVHSNKQELTLHRTSLPVSREVYHLRVNIR